MDPENYYAPSDDDRPGSEDRDSEYSETSTEPKRDVQPLRDSTFLQRVTSATAPVIPRERRRGLFAALTIVPEIERPMEYEFGVKVLVCNEPHERPPSAR